MMVDQKQYRVGDIAPSGPDDETYIIEVIDKDEKKVDGVRFLISVDEGSGEQKVTDGSGVIRCKIPLKTISITFHQ